MRAPRRVIAALIGLAALGRSAPASADWISLSNPNAKPGEVDGFLWLITGMAAAGAIVPQGLALGELRSGKVIISQKAGGGLFAAGAGLGIVFAVALGYTRSTQEAAVVTLIEGPLWSMAGVGLGRLISPSTHAGWLGGSMGFTTFALTHAALSTAGIADGPGANALQAVWGAVGGAGCFADAWYSARAERGVAIGCGVVATATVVHGIVKAARGDVSPSYRKKAPKTRALAPWINADTIGLTFSGAF